MEVSGQLHTSAALPPGKVPLVHPLDSRLGGSQSRYVRGGEEINSQPLSGLEPPNIQPITQRYTTELSGLPNLYIYIYIFFFFSLVGKKFYKLL
jgi:hypothetical protein